MAIVLANVHMDLVNHPTYEFVTVVMVIIIKLYLAGSNARDESLVVDHTAVSLGIYHVLEKLLNFIY